MTAGEDDGSSARDASSASGPAADSAEPTPDGGVARSGGVSGPAGETSEESERQDAPLGHDISRREALAYAAGTGAGLGGWKALHNVVLGYGIVGGTNLIEQDLPAYASERLALRETTVTVGGYELHVNGDRVAISESNSQIESLTFDTATVSEARAVDAELDLSEEPLTQLVADAAAIGAGDVRFVFSKVEPFFRRLHTAEERPYTVAGLRGPRFDGTDTEFVAEFAGVHPSNPAGLIEGLVRGFRTYSSYDVPRYLAGSVEDNVLLGAVNLRQYFESPTSFEALAADQNSGLFCTELVVRSIEGFHSVPATEQSPPVFAGFVQDTRHKHAYTILASAIREDGDFVIPATFVDFTHSTLYDDLHLRWLLGEGIEAYNDRHRTTGIYWNTNAGV